MSLGSILSVAAPIAAGYFGGPALAGSFGMSATGGAIAAGALTGAGIAALSGGDILTSGVMGGLGGYGGGELGAAFNPAGASGIASATGTTNAAVNQAAMSNMTGSALGQGGFNTAAGRGLMGVASPGMAGAAGAGSYGYSPYDTPDVLGESVTQFQEAQQLAGVTPQPGGYDALDPTSNFATRNAAMGSGNTSTIAGIPDELSGGYVPPTTQYTPPPDTSFSAGLERLGDGSKGKGAMKLGLAGLPVLAAAYEPETFTYDQMKEAEAYDPNATLNLDDPALDSGIEDVIDSDSGLRLYAKEGGMIPTYAEGGTIESRAKEGMAGALARNKGIAYAQPTTTASNVNTQPALNINRGMGSLNVNSGTIGQSPDAKAAQAIEDAKPKTRMMTGAYGTQMTVPIDYDPGSKSVFGGRKPSHYQLKDGTYVKGTPPSINMINSDQTNAYGYVNRFAEGGTIESRADQGMRDALARNEGIAYTRPTTAPVTTTAPSNNIKIAGSDTSNMNLTGGMGSLNVGSGVTGKSADAVAEAARLKAIEDAKPKTPKTRFIMGQGTVPYDYVGGMRPNYTRDIAGNYHKAYAEGGMLEGPGDGMSDSLAAQIDGSQPAALSQGEFVVPADVVSHLGNGSSDAGSKRLYAMMDEVRQARTGTEKQGKEINPERYMPA
jgi:hypothetical protein